MDYKRILTIQDISCVGQCSLTVALPVLSACGMETCVLPTALLSTHTGGFGKPAVVHFDEKLERFYQHWQENDISFDAILVGYLGSIAAVKAAKQVIDRMLAPGGIAIVDPAMGDHGKMYSGFDELYVQAMQDLCAKADILLPNVTEAAMLSGQPYREELSPAYVDQLLDGLNRSCVILTGVGYQPGQTGVVVQQEARRWHYVHAKTSRNFHGTGDLFAACFTGGLMRGKDLRDAARIAADFTCRTIENTMKNPAHWYGIKFEPLLPELMAMLET